MIQPAALQTERDREVASFRAAASATGSARCRVGRHPASRPVATVVATLRTNRAELKSSRFQLGDHAVDGLDRIQPTRSSVLVVAVLDGDDIPG